MSGKKTAKDTVVVSTTIPDVTDFDWNSVELIIDDTTFAFFEIIQNLIDTPGTAAKTFRDFRNLPYSFIASRMGSRRSLQWTDKDGDVVSISNSIGWYIMLKRFAQQGGNPPYNKIHVTSRW